MLRRRFFQRSDYFPEILVVDRCLLIWCMRSDQCYALVIKLVSPEDPLRATNPSLEAKIRGVYLPAGVALIGAMGADFEG
jgi:hypothetical protein